MKRIFPRILAMLTGLFLFSIGMINRLPPAIGAGILMSAFFLISAAEAEVYNRYHWDRLIRYYLKERDKHTESDMRVVLADYEIEELKKKLAAAESTPSKIYVGGFPKLTDALNRAHARNMLKAVGSEVNE